MPESDQPDEYYAHGWVEILHRNDDLPEPKSLIELTPDQYTRVGSVLPLSEYYSPVDVYHQFKDMLDPEFGVPRAFRAFDVVNLCSDEFNKIVTLVLVPRGRIDSMIYPGVSIQRTEALPLAMLTRPEIFESFYLNQQNK